MQSLDSQTAYLIIALLALIIGAVVGIVIAKRLAMVRFAAINAEVNYQHNQAFAALQAECRQARALAEQEKSSLLSRVAELQAAKYQLDQARNLLLSDLSTTRESLAAATNQAEQLPALKVQLEQQSQQLLQFTADNQKLATQMEEQAHQYQAQIALLQDAKTELTGAFENLANRIFEQKQMQFSSQSKNLLETTLDPLKLQLGDFRRKVEDVYEKENAERNRLSGQIVELQKQAQKIGEDAVNLAQALKGSNKAQGNWGEIILERLLEQSGLQKGREYDTQISFTRDDGRRQVPDVIIHLPDNKDIVIDSKVSLVDYERYASADTELERQTALNGHVQSLRNHIKQLSIKDYEKIETIRALDFVFIFIPIEAAFLAALQADPRLYSEAYDKHIILVSPTTLLATLRTVDNIWRYEKQNKNAELIAQKAGDLHDQFVALIKDMESVSGYINKAHSSFETVQKRLHTGRGNLVKRVNELKRLGAKTKKSIDPQLLEDSQLQILDGISVNDEDQLNHLVDSIEVDNH